MNVWLSNSQVIHATSSDPLTQPFERQGVVAGVFSHEPIAARAPTGETVVWYTASKCCVNGCQRCTGCHNGISPKRCGICDPPAPGAVANRNHSVNLPTYMVYSTSPYGPWSEPVEVPGTNVFADSNFAPVILSNGSIVALTRGAVIHGENWKNVSTYKEVGKWHDAGEDPFLWCGASSSCLHALPLFNLCVPLPRTTSKKESPAVLLSVEQSCCVQNPAVLVLHQYQLTRSCALQLTAPCVRFLAGHIATHG